LGDDAGVKKIVAELAESITKNWLTVVIAMVSFMLLFVCLVMFSWLYGYWSNALWGTKFELGSCWQGVSATITGLAGVAAMAKAAWTKYSTDSQFNSAAGEHPYIRNVSDSGTEMEKK
jgi:hypothetical protein